MKLSKLYSNKTEIFEPIVFNRGLNVILGEIRLPKNKGKDTHNLGKTTLGRLIDFLLLSKKDKDFFLFKHEKIFKDFIFFLEVEVNEKSFLTVRRGVEQPSKISFKKHVKRCKDFSKLGLEKWDHENVPFEKAKYLLDSILNLEAIKPWTFRDEVGYLLRTQDDYSDVFKLKKYQSKEAYWKPYLAHILGFDSKSVQKLYKEEEFLKEKKDIAKTVQNELGEEEKDIGQIEGILHLKKEQAYKMQKVLDSFDFLEEDKDKTNELVNEIEEKIASLNDKRYYVEYNKRKINKSLEEDSILFNPDQAEKIFNEVGVLFKGQIKKDFEQLINFNKAITEERIGYLLEEKSELEQELLIIAKELNELSDKRTSYLAFISDTESFNKYKSLSNELVNEQSDIKLLEKQKTYLNKLYELQVQIQNIKKDIQLTIEGITKNVRAQVMNNKSMFSQIRLFFSEIINKIITRKALLNIKVNDWGHLDFKAEILDERSTATSADVGHTYKKLLCIAFDLAVINAYLNERFPKFAFHDGVLESLDDRKKENLIALLREFSCLGMQSIITVIDSDLPKNGEITFSESEIVLRLHDQGISGRLFKIAAW